MQSARQGVPGARVLPTAPRHGIRPRWSAVGPRRRIGRGPAVFDRPGKQLRQLMSVTTEVKRGVSPIEAPRDPSDKHIVDVLIEERAGSLLEHPLTWWAVQRWLYPILNYEAAVRLADSVAPLGGLDVLEHVSRWLDVRVDVDGLERVPRQGLVFVLANHPTGIADGIAVYQALKEIRPDLYFVANRDALRVAPRLAEVVAPVEWRNDHRRKSRTREMLAHLAQAVEKRRAIVFFPSGRLAHMRWRGLTERPWLPTPLSLARKNGASVVPLHLSGRNSWFYYGLAQLSTELRDITVFNELLNKRGHRFRLTFGEPLDPEALPDDAEAATKRLQTHVERDLPRGRTRITLG